MCIIQCNVLNDELFKLIASYEKSLRDVTPTDAQR